MVTINGGTMSVEITIKLSEDDIQTIQRRQRIMDTMDANKKRLQMQLLEAENQKLARLVCESYRKQVEWR
jgi:hypothetical protein